MSKKEPFSIEVPINCSPSILFEFLSTASGLQEWFADKVEEKGEFIFFTWGKNTQKAECIEVIEDELIAYQWVEADDEEYFEFQITHSNLTNETTLQITDFAEKSEIEDQQLLWESQVSELKQRIGSE